MRAYTVGNPETYEDAIDDPKGCEKCPGGAVFETLRDATNAIGIFEAEALDGRGFLPPEWFPGRDPIPGKVYVVELPTGFEEDSEPCNYGFGARQLTVAATLSRLEE